MKIKVNITTDENCKYYGCEPNTVKEIELEDYVAAVTASEIGNSPLEACKAQAIAARTFAASRGVLEGKIISDSAAKAQAFRAPRNNYKNCNAAAEATSGLILTSGGKPAAVVYTNSNGGRTYSSEEVWGGKRDYLIARDDPWTAATHIKKSGHGVGLSQVGATYAAGKGITCIDILQFYYPGTMLTLAVKNDTKHEVLLTAKQKLLEAIKQIGEML